AFDPAAVDPARIGALRKVWQIPPAARILLVPGRVAPWNGQLIVPEIARTMLDSGMRGLVFVLARGPRTHPKYAPALVGQAPRCAVTGSAGRTLPRSAGGAGRSGYRDDALDRAAGTRPRGGTSASYGPAGRRVEHWRLARTRGRAAGNAGRGANGVGGRRCKGICPRDHRRMEPRRCRVPHDGRPRTPLRP